MPSNFYIGLMCGTSADGIDAALVDWLPGKKHQLIMTHEQPLPEDLRASLLDLNNNPQISLKKLSLLDNEIARAHAHAVSNLLLRADISREQVQAIGFHGQTIDHSPEAAIGNTTQLGNAQLLATATGISVIADVRRADMALGGQGAPLAPAMHAELIRVQSKDTAVVNIGGIANLSLLPASQSKPVLGFDTGPGNCLLDEWVRKTQNKPYDNDGVFAQSGKIESELLKKLMLNDYVNRPSPKSTGRDLFNLSWLEKQLDGYHYKPENVQATLAAFTAKTIAIALISHAPSTQELYVCGGGAKNTALMQSLQTTMPEVEVSSTQTLGIEPDWVEAILMSWIAKQYCKDLPSNLPSVTGASQPVRLGVKFDPPRLN